MNVQHKLVTFKSSFAHPSIKVVVQPKEKSLILEYSEEVKTKVEKHLQAIQATTEQNYFYPIFVITKMDHLRKNLTYGYLDKQETHLLFVLVEPSEAKAFDQALLKVGSMNYILVLAPENNLDASVLLELEKQIIMHFGFNLYHVK